MLGAPLIVPAVGRGLRSTPVSCFPAYGEPSAPPLIVHLRDNGNGRRVEVPPFYSNRPTRCQGQTAVSLGGELGSKRRGNLGRARSLLRFHASFPCVGHKFRPVRGRCGLQLQILGCGCPYPGVERDSVVDCRGGRTVKLVAYRLRFWVKKWYVLPRPAHPNG